MEENTVSPSKPKQAPAQAKLIADLIAHVDLELADAAETAGVVARDVVEWVIDRVITALRSRKVGQDDALTRLAQ